MKLFCKRKTEHSGNGKEILPVTIFDCSIEDPEERRLQAQTFRTALLAATYLGTNTAVVFKYSGKSAIIQKLKYYSKKQNKSYTIRLNVKDF